MNEYFSFKPSPPKPPSSQGGRLGVLCRLRRLVCRRRRHPGGGGYGAGVAGHDVGAGEIAGQEIAAFHVGVYGREHLAEQLGRAVDVDVIAAVWGQQDGFDDDDVDRRHDHALRVVQPLQVPGEIG